MVDIASDEHELVRDALVGVALAVADSDHLDDEAFSFVGSTKLEKFVCEGLYEQGELSNVTHSWYLAGVKTEADANPETLRSVAPQLTAGSNRGQDFVDRGDDDAPSERARQFAEFYRTNYPLEEYWRTSSEEFLLEFYERAEFVPEAFRSLYVSVQRLRNVLSEVEDAADTRETTLADFGNGSVGFRDRYKEVGQLVSAVHIELSEHEQLRETIASYRAFTDVLEDVYLELRETEMSSIGTEEVDLLRWLHDKHYNQAWKLPALVISVETSAGPHGDSLRVERARRLESHQQQLERTIEEAIERCEAVGLLPSTGSYPQRDPQFRSSLEEFISSYVERDV